MNGLPTHAKWHPRVYIKIERENIWKLLGGLDDSVIYWEWESW